MLAFNLQALPFVSNSTIKQPQNAQNEMFTKKYMFFGAFSPEITTLFLCFKCRKMWKFINIYDIIFIVKTIITYGLLTIY